MKMTKSCVDPKVSLKTFAHPFNGLECSCKKGYFSIVVFLNHIVLFTFENAPVEYFTTWDAGRNKEQKGQCFANGH